MHRGRPPSPPPRLQIPACTAPPGLQLSRPHCGSLSTSVESHCGAWALRNSLPSPAPPPTRSPEPDARTRRADQGRKSRRAAKPAVDAAILASEWAGRRRTSGRRCAGAEAAPSFPPLRPRVRLGSAAAGRHRAASGPVPALASPPSPRLNPPARLFLPVS